MSLIYFHSMEKIISAKKLKLIDAYCASIFMSFLGDVEVACRKSDTVYHNLIPTDAYCWVNGNLNALLVKEYFGSHENIFLNNHEIDSHDVQMNTVLLMGSDLMKLMVRLNNERLEHSYIQGKNRAWLAKILEKGLKANVLQSKDGWTEVIALLGESDNNAIVISGSSVKKTLNFSDFFDLQNNIDLELNPDTWNEFTYGDGKTVFDVLEQMNYPVITDFCDWYDTVLKIEAIRLGVPNIP